MNDNRKAPAYVQLAETIKARILRDEYRAGEMLAPARELEREFGTSAITVRKAMTILAREGYINPKQGVGTIVMKHPEQMVELELTGNFWNWADSALTRNLETQTHVLGMEIVPCPQRVAHLLHLNAETAVWRLKRIRTINGEPASYIVNYTSPELFDGVDRDIFTARPFLDVFRDHCGTTVASVAQRVRATVADIDISNKLAIDFGDPVFLVENTYLDDAQTPVAASCLHFRGDRYVYKTNISF
jgi:DNA-binding GntR family transcriptional regulator